MNATPSRSSARRRRSWGVRPWTLVVYGFVVALGGLIQACTDNKGGEGPVFNDSGPAGTTGFANTSADIIIRVSANPASTEPGRRVTITVLVTNGAAGGSGQPLAGKRVFVSTSTTPPVGGTVDAPSGVTNANGMYTTGMIVRCVDAGVAVPAVEPAPEEPAAGNTIGTVTVDAFVDGASSADPGGTSATVIVTGTGANAPCPGSA